MDKLTDPVPKGLNSIREKDGWAITSTIDVDSIELDGSLSFADVTLSRRTNRDCQPMDLPDVLALIQLVVRSRQIGEGDNRGRLRKIALSAGALHPIEVLVIAGQGVSDPILYCDASDTFGTVCFCSPDGAKAELQTLAEIVPLAKGHLLLFVANRRHIDQAYDQPVSLLWRDGGALLQTFSLVSSALGLSFIPLGSTGRAVLSALEAPHADYVAVGTAVIGKGPTRIDASAA